MFWRQKPGKWTKSLMENLRWNFTSPSQSMSPTICSPSTFFSLLSKGTLFQKGATRHVAHHFLGMQMIYNISNLHDISMISPSMRPRKLAWSSSAPLVGTPGTLLGSGQLVSTRNWIRQRIFQLAACIGILDLTEDGRLIMNENIDSNSHNFPWRIHGAGILMLTYS